MWCPHPLLYSQRLSSTTTRIKTTPSAAVLATASVVRDYLPLQQGLRPARTWLKNSPLLVRDYLPLQQGLRRFPSPSAGLIDFLVRDYLPLQQGLRLNTGRSLQEKIKCQRLSSTTTRIKTCFSFLLSLIFRNVRDYLPLQQGLRLLKSQQVFHQEYQSETIFHYNKD